MKTTDSKVKKFFIYSASISIVLISISLFLYSIQKTFASNTVTESQQGSINVDNGYIIIGASELSVQGQLPKIVAVGFNKNAPQGSRLKFYQ